MPKNGDQFIAGLVAKLAAEAKTRLGPEEAGALDPFFAAYYANVAPRDLADTTAQTLFAAALAHWRFAERRLPNTARVRAYNPNLEADGWKSARTVIEAVTDDMPFLVDSLAAELSRQGLVAHLVVHPIVAVRRDGDGTAACAVPRDTDDKQAKRESFLRAEVTAQNPDRLSAIAEGVAKVLDDVRAAVEDWAGMRARMAETAAGLQGAPGAETAEAREFLLWAHDNNFTFIGARDYDIVGAGDKARFSVAPGSGLGILRDPVRVVFEENRERVPIPPEVRAYLERPEPLMITKANRKSPVHRPVHLDAISVKRRDGAGRINGERVFVGLFTSGAYSRTPRDIPLLRRKTEAVIARAAFRPGGHDAKALQHILDSYPRDELFQIGSDDLHDIARGVLQLQERVRVALFLRRDNFERFISALVYIPRDRYTTDLRLRIQAILERAFAGTVASHYIQFDDSPLARLLVVVQTVPGKIPPLDQAKLED